MQHRYRLFREHKYLFDFFTELLQFTARLDFTDGEQRAALADRISKLKLLLEGHAHFEETRILALLESQCLALVETVSRDHLEQATYFTTFDTLLQTMVAQETQDTINGTGYEFYLTLRRFFADNLRHFDVEELDIMRALQAQLTDEQIREIERISYRQMSSMQMLHMLVVLFPHFNYDDKIALLTDIKDYSTTQFAEVLDGILSYLEPHEQDKIAQHFNIMPQKKAVEIAENLYYPWEEKPAYNAQNMLNKTQETS